MAHEHHRRLSQASVILLTSALLHLFLSAHSSNIVNMRSCCLGDLSGNPRACQQPVAIPSVAGGNHRELTPSHLMRCINDVNRTHHGKPSPWSEDLAHVQAAGAWWSPKQAIVPVTVVTQLSASRLPQLWAQCRSWRGPLSAAVYLPKQDGAGIVTKKQIWCAMQQTYALYMLARDDDNVCDLDVVLLYEQRTGRGSVTEYPVNVLRNMARLQARTAMVAMIDVDMLMSREMMRWLHAPANVITLERQCRAHSVYVLPAFEVLGNSTAEAALVADRYSSVSKRSLLAGVANGTLSSFAALRYARGHYATNFSWWAGTSEPYEVAYASGFEPWVLTHRQLAPWHDSRFRGYGLNKISHIAHLNASSYKFIVHPSAFIIHRAHNSSQARKRFNSDMLNYYLTHKHRDLANGTAYSRQADKALNSYFKVNHLFVVMKQDMDRNKFVTVLDPASRRCRRNLPWWAK